MLQQGIANRLSVEELVAHILQFLAADPGRMARFFNVTGLCGDTIRDAAAGPGFSASVMDYVLEDEELVKEFAASAAIAPEELLRVRSRLERRTEVAPKEKARVAAPHGASNLARQFGAA